MRGGGIACCIVSGSIGDICDLSRSYCLQRRRLLHAACHLNHGASVHIQSLTTEKYAYLTTYSNNPYNTRGVGVAVSACVCV